MRTLCWACGAYSAGIILSVLALPERLWLPLAGALLLAWLPLRLLKLRWLRGKWPARCRLAALFAALGILTASAQQLFVLRPAEKLDGETRTVSVRALDYPDVYDTGSYLYVRLEEPGLPSVKCRLSAWESGLLADARPGDLLRLRVSFSSAQVRYGEETELYCSRGVFLLGRCGESLTLLERDEQGLRFLPQRIRRSVCEAVGRLFPADASAFLTALLTGEKKPLYEDAALYTALSRSGLMHVAAVSGMHVSLLLGFLSLIIPNKRLSLILGVPLLAIFMGVSGFSPSVCRAALMAILFLLANVSRQEGDPPTALTLILAVLLALNPHAAAGAGLQMSFAATAGLLLFAEPIMDYLRTRLGLKGRHGGLWGLLNGICAAAAASVSAQIFTVPLSLLHFGFVSVVAPVTNILCLWVVSILFTLGYPVLALGAFFPAAGRVCGGILARGVRYIRRVCFFLSGLPAASVYASWPYVLWIVFVYGIFFVCWLRRDREKGFRVLTPLCLSIISLCCVTLGLSLFRPSALRTAVLDVGQGACTVLECGDTVVVVDCGGTYSDKPAERAAGYLRGRAHQRIDALVLTHLHTDHANGAAELLGLMEVGELLIPADADDSNGCLWEILDAAAETGTDVKLIREDTMYTDGRLELRLYPSGQGGGENERGLLALCSVGEYDVLITGDAGREREAEFVMRSDLPDIELLQVGHHGSAGSTSAWLLERLRPETAVISVGYNTYGHPTEEVLDRLERYGVTVHRTDLEGNVTIRSQGD